MDTTGDTGTASDADTTESESALGGADSTDLRTRLAVLEAENRQLRDEYARARQATYRRTALGLFVVGAVGVLGGLIFADARTVLFALGGTGVFAGVLTYVLTPERFVSARIGARVVQALRADRDAIISELGLAGEPVYVPADDVRLFVPRRASTPLPAVSALTDLFVIPESPDRGGVAFHPTGEPLFEEFDASRPRSVDPTPHAVAQAVADALVELFELADGVACDVDTETNRITFEIDGADLGDPTGIDHPIPSFLSVGLARMLDASVRVDVREDPLTITCRYDRTWSQTIDEPEETDRETDAQQPF